MMTVNLSTPYFKYGAPALYKSLGALPFRHNGPPPFTIGPATEERIQIECEIVDEWVVELFHYCCRRSSADLRVHAMLLDAKLNLDPNDAYLRIGLYPTWEACLRVRHWLSLVTQLRQYRA